MARTDFELPPGLSVNELIKIGVEVRDELRAEKRQFDAFEASVKDMMARISMALKAKGDELGVNSFNTSEGTAYRNLKESYRMGSWDEFLAYMIKTGRYHLVEKRVAKLACKEIHRAEGLPPGVEYFAEEEFLIRRPNDKGNKDE